MSYLLTGKAGESRFDGELAAVPFEDGTLYHRFLSEDQASELLAAYRTGALAEYLHKTDIHRFLAIIVDDAKKTMLLVNDKFGSNHLLYAMREGVLYASDDAARLFAVWGEKPRINLASAYELIDFYTICPPRTIFEGVQAVPMGAMLRFDAAGAHVESYWDFAAELRAKEYDYEKLLASYRDAFVRSVKTDFESGTTAVALSGGVDSGGILGVLTDIAQQPIPSISIGAYGPNSGDLISARITAKEHESPLVCLYPTLADIAKLPTFMKGLEQPYNVDVLLPNALIFEEAKSRGHTRVAFGFGSEMLLGNLAMAKFSDKINKVERFLPRILRPALYHLYARVRRLSRNQLEFLLAPSWPARFLHVRGPLLSRERGVYKNIPADFPSRLERDFDGFLAQLPLGDAIVCMYLTSWENFLQWHDVGEFSRRYGIECIMPFDTPEVVREMFKAPMAVRRMKDWDKLLIRDMFKPFISRRMHDAKGRSLIIPYTKLLAPVKDEVIAYLETSPVVSELVDFARYRERYEALPEPGLHLARLLGLAIWYDVNWNTANMPRVDALMETMRQRSVPYES
ncbi:hypothetical protein FJY94_06340 [Candidatus Kaiserbacteria bacterium]|nr:hypothetical protein [Candidatus Kaiserbacteria bacterium]